jgi:hypothetical protein
LHLDHERQKSHEAGTLDRVAELALVPDADAGALARDDLPERGKVALQGIRIFVVDVFDVREAENALAIDLLGWSWHRDIYLSPHHAEGIGTTGVNKV